MSGGRHYFETISFFLTLFSIYFFPHWLEPPLHTHLLIYARIFKLINVAQRETFDQFIQKKKKKKKKRKEKRGEKNTTRENDEKREPLLVVGICVRQAESGGNALR